jgi:hypothetical protein
MGEEACRSHGNRLVSAEIIIGVRDTTMNATMESSPQPQQRSIELGVSPQYAQAHGWVVHALTGWLSAYYMEDPRFRVLRRFHELETGIEVWVCEHEGDLPMKRLIARLRTDFPPYQIHERTTSSGEGLRYLVDLP